MPSLIIATIKTLSGAPGNEGGANASVATPIKQVIESIQSCEALPFYRLVHFPARSPPPPLIEVFLRCAMTSEIDSNYAFEASVLRVAI
jgi:hypothetical protein